MIQRAVPVTPVPRPPHAQNQHPHWSITEPTLTLFSTHLPCVVQQLTSPPPQVHRERVSRRVRCPPSLVLPLPALLLGILRSGTPRKPHHKYVILWSYLLRNCVILIFWAILCNVDSPNHCDWVCDSNLEDHRKRSPKTSQSISLDPEESDEDLMSPLLVARRSSSSSSSESRARNLQGLFLSCFSDTLQENCSTILVLQDSSLHAPYLSFFL